MTSTNSEPGDRVLDGRYRLGERIGSGAVAEVFRAVDERLERSVAIKVFRGDAAEQLQRHDAEMRTLAALDHPSLVTVFDAGTDEESDCPYLVMQLIEGRTLSDELRVGPLPPARAARYGASLADALHYVHQRGLVHRDVKPGNVLISADGRVHLADFGIARLVDAAHQTRTGDVLGTPAYFAPEQVAGEPIGPPVDVYALGIVLLECVTGRRPFEGTAMEVAMARLARDPEVPTSLPGPWRNLLTAMTQRDPQQRPTADRVADALRDLADGAATEATSAMAAPPTAATTVIPPAAASTQVMPPTASTSVPVARVARRRGLHPAVIAMIIVLVAVVVGAIVFAVHHNSGGNNSPSFKPGSPRLHQPLERDVRRLERLVRP